MKPETPADRTPTDLEREVGRAAIERIRADLKGKKGKKSGAETTETDTF